MLFEILKLFIYNKKKLTKKRLVEIPTLKIVTLSNVLEENMINKNLISQLPITTHGCTFNMYLENFAIKAEVSTCVKILVTYHLGLVDV